MKIRTVLLVDDEAHVVHVMALKLRNAGYRVVTASDGRQALAAARQELPDLLITDYHMPGLSGLELCRRLKQSASTSRIPTIMLTARGYELDEQETLRSGILMTVPKPFSQSQLVASVHQLLAA